VDKHHLGGLVQNDAMQGARVLRNEAYNPYAARTKDEAQHNRSWLRADTIRQARFSTAWEAPACLPMKSGLRRARPFLRLCT